MVPLLLSALVATALTGVPTLVVPAPGATGPVSSPGARVPGREARAPAPAAGGAWPLQPGHRVVGGFDPPDSPWGAGHRGVDLLGHPGQAVHAALAGTVTFAGMLAGRGVVVVDHGGTRTTYEPVSASAAVGETVRRGQVIGTLQVAMSHCFPRACLHWGLLRGSSYLDPLGLVGAGPVRLLPMPAQARGWANR